MERQGHYSRWRNGPSKQGAAKPQGQGKECFYCHKPNHQASVLFLDSGRHCCEVLDAWIPFKQNSGGLFCLTQWARTENDVAKPPLELDQRRRLMIHDVQPRFGVGGGLLFREHQGRRHAGHRSTLSGLPPSRRGACNCSAQLAANGPPGGASTVLSSGPTGERVFSSRRGD